jgi:anti-sigma B factor antagonist
MFTFAVREAREFRIVALEGELDLSTSVGLLEHLVSRSDTTTVVDLVEVSFMDSAGISTLVRARNRLAEGGGRLVLTRPPENVYRTLEVVGLADWVSEWNPEWSKGFKDPSPD